MKVIVTRPLGQAAPWVTRLQALGVEAQALPLLQIEPLADLAPLRAAWARLPGCAMVMFVSANAVGYFFAAAPNASTGTPASWPSGVWAASPGPGTTAALKQAGVPPSWLVEPDPQAGRFDSEALWAEVEFRPWAGRRVLVVRGEEGRDWLADALRARGAQVDFVAAYRRRAPAFDAAGQQLLADSLALPERYVWHFSSSEGIACLKGLQGPQSLGDRSGKVQPASDWAHSQALASHPRIVQSARDIGFGRVHEVGASAQAVADWLAQPPAGLRKSRRT